MAGGKEIGTVSSGTFAPTLGKSIAMAYVESAHKNPGTLVAVDIRGKEERAKVVPMPFYHAPGRN